jgi:tRNA (Thr-GGU) A37 N-methylase
VVKLVEIESNCLTVKWLDALDNSPVLDIKPFWPEIDCP